jgi:hypothetical protein
VAVGRPTGGWSVPDAGVARANLKERLKPALKFAGEISVASFKCSRAKTFASFSFPEIDGLILSAEENDSLRCPVWRGTELGFHPKLA